MRGVLALLLAAGALPAAAGELPEVWFTPGLLSHHFQQDRGFREVNYGPGAEVVLDTRHDLLAGGYRNSDDDHSHYAALYWHPLQWGPVGAGVVVGAFDGYRAMRDGGWFPAALPMVSLRYGRVGVNLTAIPSIGERLHGALAAQFVFRVF